MKSVKYAALALLLSTSAVVAKGVPKIVSTPTVFVEKGGKVPVTMENYEWAETDVAFYNIAKIGGNGAWFHFPGVTPLDNQTVVRMNRDTVYSGYVADVSEGATITLPKTDGRYLSVMIVDNGQYIDQVFLEPGTHEIKAKTKFVMIVARTQINPNDPKDIENVKKYQSMLKVETKSKEKFKMLNYDTDQLLALRSKLVAQGSSLGSLNNMQGPHGSVDPLMHIFGTALGWGLLPDKNARYLNYYSKGETAKSANCSAATFKKPPFIKPGFFSVTVYNKAGWIANEQSILNNYNVKYNDDGSFTAHFGANCPEGTPNVLKVEDDWDYLFRVYQPDLDKLEAYELPTPKVIK